MPEITTKKYQKKINDAARHCGMLRCCETLCHAIAVETMETRWLTPGPEAVGWVEIKCFTLSSKARGMFQVG
jgi:hypothetical protein